MNYWLLFLIPKLGTSGEIAPGPTTPLVMQESLRTNINEDTIFTG